MTRMNFPALTRASAVDVSADGSTVLIAGNGRFCYVRSPVLGTTTQPGGGTVELVGSDISGAVGLDLAGGKSVVRGFIFNEFTDANEVPLLLREAGGNLVAGHYFGTDATGTGPSPPPSACGSPRNKAVSVSSPSKPSTTW